MALAPCVLGSSQPAAEHASAVNAQDPSGSFRTPYQLFQQSLSLPSRSGGSCSSPQSPKHPSTGHRAASVPDTLQVSKGNLWTPLILFGSDTVYRTGPAGIMP
ncbi:hypothetical protein Taro_020283 [Colocasia esculenta]|uniref:Uncharacterized protein n=1 Tax=Colocasia esculenta TaxID=4460 RepID=A0A843UYF3_COLES|nr:hypothetical protein [Colocasia esculenta]